MNDTPNKIHATDAAVQQIIKALQRRGRGLGIKIGVRTTGCSGLAYALEFVDEEQGREICMEHHDIKGIRIYMDPCHRPYLYGVTLDYQRRGLNEGFEFINENEGGRCGCGESWYVKNSPKEQD